jgi:hypothetical protein
MHDNDDDDNSFLLEALEAAHPDQITDLLRISEEKGISLQELLDRILAEYLLRVTADGDPPLPPDTERWCREVLEEEPRDEGDQWKATE